LYVENVRIIVIDEDYEKLKNSFMIFCKILNGKSTTEILTKETARIEGRGFHIRFYVKPSNNTFFRGIRCDYLLNNTQDEIFHKETALPMMSLSNFLRSN
jgi:hypothetical protein